MARTSLASAMQHVCTLVAAAATKGRSDRQLLRQFADKHDEAAFAALVQRHGPLVLNVCRRVLRNAQDAEDVFQATFLVLARKAGSVLWRESVQGWLYQVAYRLSLEARRQRARRQRYQGDLPSMPDLPARTEKTLPEAQALLDDELARLPDRYRAPLILCYLEGKTRDEAAEALGWTLGAVKGRLERGREILRNRLARRGATLSAALLATLWTTQASAAAVPALLLVSTVRAGVDFAAGTAASGLVATSVLSLTQGALRTMILAKLKLAAACGMAVAVLGFGLGAATHSSLIAEQPASGNVALTPPSPNSAIDNPDDEKKDKKDGDKKEGDQKEGDQKKATLRGKVVGVNLKNHSLTVSSSGGDGEGKFEATVAVAKDAVILIDGKPAKLDSLKEGTLVSLVIMEDKNTATRIVAEGATRNVVLKAVDAEKSTITLRAGDGGQREEVLKVAKDATIGKPAGEGAKAGTLKLGDLKLGRVTLIMSVDGETVVSIRPADERKPMLYGAVKAIDVKARRITITIKRDGGAEDDRTVSVDKKARIFGVDEGDLAKVKEGIMVRLVLAPDGKEVIEIQDPKNRERDKEQRDND